MVKIYVKYMCITTKFEREKIVRKKVPFMSCVAWWFCFHIMSHVSTLFFVLSLLFIFFLFFMLTLRGTSASDEDAPPSSSYFFFSVTRVNFVYKNKVNIYQNNKFNFFISFTLLIVSVRFEILSCMITAAAAPLRITCVKFTSTFVSFKGE